MHDYFYKTWEGNTYLVINDDIDLKPVWILQPDPPREESIANYGLRKEDQKFFYQVMPDNLKSFDEIMKSEAESNTEYTISQILRTISQNQSQFRKEIQFIKEQHVRSEEGWWLYINGVKTHMTPSNYNYVNYWYIDSITREDGLPDYRLRDQVFFQVLDWGFYHDNILGFAYYKYRREGATSKVMCDWYFKGIRWPSMRNGFQSQSDTKAEKTFSDQFIIPWSKLPLFYRPEWGGTELPSGELYCRPAARRITQSGGYAKTNMGLESKFNYGNSAVDFYDGYAMDYYYGDEFAKRYTKAPVDTYQRHVIVKDTMIQGSLKRGFCVYTSTVGNEKEDGDDEGGIEYAEAFHDNSKYWETPTDQFTPSGLWPFFISSVVGLEGFNDEYGNPIIEDPDVPVRNEVGQLVTVGARRHLEMKLEAVKKTGNWKVINETYRKHPITYMDCFRTSSGSAIFDQSILNERIIQLEKSKYRQTRTGRIEPINPLDKFGPMQFVDDAQGKWEFSQQPPTHIANSWYMDQSDIMGNGQRPKFPLEYSVSCDPVQFERGTSKAAITVKRAPLAEDNGRMPSEWKGDQFVADWISDVTDVDEVSYEVFKVCRFFSTMLHGEKNVDVVNKWFKDKFFHGYLSFEIDEKGKVASRAGYSVQGGSKQVLLAYADQYIKRRGPYEKHLRILRQYRAMRRADDMKKLDLFASTLGNFAYEQNNFAKFVVETTSEETGIEREIETHY
jgi:hypothetical protein